MVGVACNQGMGGSMSLREGGYKGVTLVIGELLTSDRGGGGGRIAHCFILVKLCFFQSVFVIE